MKTLYIAKDEDSSKNISYYHDHIQQFLSNNDKGNDIFLSFINEIYRDAKMQRSSEDFLVMAKDALSFYLDEENNQTIHFSKLTLKENLNAIKFVATRHDFLMDVIKNLLSHQNIHYKNIFILSIAKSSDKVLVYITTNEIYSADLLEEMKKYIKLIDCHFLAMNKDAFKMQQILTLESQDSENPHEIAQFLKFISQDNLWKIFSCYNLIDDNIIEKFGDLDICNSSKILQISLNLQTEDFALGSIFNELFYIAFNKAISYIAVKKKNKTIIFLGFYDGLDDYKKLNNIPILKNKLNYLTHSAINLYQIKKIQTLLQIIPNELLLQISNDDVSILLYELSKLIAGDLRAKFIVYKDTLEEFIHIFILLSKDNFNLDIYDAFYKLTIKNLGEKTFGEYYHSKNFTYIHFSNVINKDNLNVIDWQEFEKSIHQISNIWENSLLEELKKLYGENGYNIFIQYGKFLDIDYQKQFSVENAIVDINKAKESIENNQMIFNLEIISQKSYLLSVYTADRLMLSDILPMLDNLGFKVCFETRFTLNGVRRIGIHKFNILPINSSELSRESLKINVEEAFYRIMDGSLASDSLNKLIILAGFNSRQITILKALTRYLHQTLFVYGKGYVQQILIKHHSYSKFFIELLNFKFNPEEVNLTKVSSLENSMHEYLAKVKVSSEDQVLRSMLLLIKAIVRTNIFQVNDKGRYKDYLSFKFDSSKVANLPKPIPYAEIYVYSNNFEGIHLRGGKIARGGLRWSDRAEDYRAEALGLMKAQMTKNSVIVPTGSKGAFFVKLDKTELSKELYFSQVVICYQNFLRGLLDLTDNIIDGKIIPPQNLVILDEEDPYLVVAADKGTASFSDYANEVAKEYNFWLGDGFASGGNTGYDHKKLGITAKGAWISVKRHFADINIDADNHPITVVGIGDMSGDVFGNGLLSSKSLKLVAAFNHIHIFLDPHPIPSVSFEERKRLFNLPTSNWSDYNQEIISAGGGVFERCAKTISLSKEIKALLEIEEDSVTPDYLISSILKAKVDLIWNGGIGTYIKATSENNIDICDKTNDDLRCNGSEIRALVIAEGGNVGVSQLGRIEYSKNNGRINTDFIDNSAGVDCSDHEVNIKIILNEVVKKGQISLQERNQILKSMSDEIEELVLQDNFKQTRSISIMEKSLNLGLEMHSRFIKYAEKEGLLNRAVEFLPSVKDMDAKIKHNEKLLRLELAIILSYSKILCKKHLNTGKLLTQKYFIKFLYAYFPQIMQEKFLNYILAGPLKNEILNNVITNDVINVLTGPLLYSISLSSDKTFDDVLSCYFIVADLFNIRELWGKIESLDSNVSVKPEIQIELFDNLIKLLRRGIIWLLKNNTLKFEIDNIIKAYSKGLNALLPQLQNFFLGTTKERFDNKYNYYINNSVNQELARQISMMEFAVSAFDIISIAQSTSRDEIQLAALYFKISENFEFDWLRKMIESDIANNYYWNLLSKQAVKDDLYQKQRKLLEKIAIEFPDCNLEDWKNKYSYNNNIFQQFILDLKVQKSIDLAMIIVANKKLELLL